MTQGYPMRQGTRCYGHNTQPNDSGSVPHETFLENRRQYVKKSTVANEFKNLTIIPWGFFF